MTEKKLLLATTNEGKVKEIDHVLSPLHLEILSIKDISSAYIFIETGKTFKQNATEKTLFYSRIWPGLTLGEDSGLEVQELSGAPGVLSARYAGESATDEQNIQKVLMNLNGIPKEKRKARFVSHMVLADKDKVIHEIQESVQGYILTEKKGTHGFGYDPIFFYPPLNKTFAQLSPKEKNSVSHRGKALKKLRAYLKDHFSCSSFQL
ncbi:MAG: RdgB/HAM1 family non-canonical purine NTP pyrophosphatase [Candidatus Aminicenantes bacterium]|nr:RdgB/HAM1 family non-canonical purine NTP pyrophosphatase [Candidatus Aminicenantes bacterium]